MELQPLLRQKSTPSKSPEEKSVKKPEGCVSLCLKGIGSAGEKEIRKFLKGCSVQAVRVVIDRATGESRGIAFVDFTSTEDVDKAMAFSGVELSGQTVQMRYEAPKLRPRPDGCLCVAVKKLPAEATEADVKKLFKGLDSTSEVRVILDRQTKACNGLAFVEFAKAADVEAAVRRDGMSVQGQTVFICYETKQKKARRDTAKEEPVKSAGSAEAAENAGDDEEQRPKKKKAKKNLSEAKEEVSKEEEAVDQDDVAEAPDAAAAEDAETGSKAAAEADKKARKMEARKERRKRKQAENAVGGEEEAAEEAPAADAQEADAEVEVKAGKAPRKKKLRKAMRAMNN